MLAIGLCLAAFIACYLAGRRSLGQGMVAVLAFGYFYGIIRANLLTTFSHFIFDAAVAGLYLSARWTSAGPLEKKLLKPVQMWTLGLMAWPVLLVLMPFQPLLVSLVGLRGCIYFIPLLILGARLTKKDLLQFSVGLAVLDLVALAFAVGEYFLGVERFFPLNAVTVIMYNSHDVAGDLLRIPSTFVNSHAYAGTMLSTMPFLIGLWIYGQNRFFRLIAMISIPGVLIGVLMSATRLNFVMGCGMVIFVLFRTRLKSQYRILFLVIIAGVTIAALSNERFQRFKTLDDADYVSDRIAGSVNRNFWEILIEYPMGNGLGGGGTSIPYFLEGQVRNPIGMENEYARILSEQGIIGFLIWASFLIWFLWHGRAAFGNVPWGIARKLTWCTALLAMGTGMIGTGLLTSIPETMLLMVGMGWVLVSGETQPDVPAHPMRISLKRPRRGYVPALQ